MNAYMIGSDIIGADAPKAMSPQEFTAAYNAEVAKIQAAQPKQPNWLQREAFGGMKGWQVLLAGGGVALMLGGIVTLIVRKR